MPVKNRPCRVTAYAEAVVSGEIVSGRLHRLACQRHLDDLVKGPLRGLSWDQSAADDILDYMPECLTITEGAKEGEPFHPLDWMVFAAGSLFGWKDKNGLRRFRFAWIEAGKGSAKSPFSAAIGIYVLRFAGIPRADVYCIGEDKDTAKVIFKDAVAMCRAPIPNGEGETLESAAGLKIRGTGALSYKLEYMERGAAMQPIANTDSNSGPKPSLVLGDEIHEMKANTSIETWRDALAKMSGDPLMILTTNTASVDQHVATEYAEAVQKVLEGDIEDDSVFGLIFRTDPDDDPFNDETCWGKSLPALGITFPIENVRAQVVSASYDVSRRLRVERLYFGIPVGSAGFWMDEFAWDAAQGVVDPDKLAKTKRECHAALDLSKKNDLTALSVAWASDEPGGNVPLRTWYWTCENELEKRSASDRVDYRLCAEEGEITIVKAKTIKYPFVAAQVQQLHATQNLTQLVADPAYLSEFLDACEDIGFDVWLYEGEGEIEGKGLKIVRHRQGGMIAFPKSDPNNPKKQIYPNWLDMPHSIQKLKDGILQSEITIHKQKLCTINAANVIMKPTPHGNEYFDKSRKRGRIDGTVTKAMAIGSIKSRKQKSAAVQIISL